MNGRHPRRSRLAVNVSALGAGASFVLAATGWTSATASDEASALFGTTELSVHMAPTGQTAEPVGLSSELYGEAGVRSTAGEQTARSAGGKLKPSAPTHEMVPSQVGLHGPEPSTRAGLPGETAPRRPNGRNGSETPDRQLDLLIAEAGFDQPEAQSEPVKTADHGLSGGRQEDEQAQSRGGAAPSVAVRVSRHDEYERIAFEWPAAIGHEVVQRGDEVMVVFDRPGRIDLSELRAGSGHRVIEARAVGGDTTDQVVLRVLPDAQIRALSLDDDRTVAIDVFGAMATQIMPSPPPEPNRDSVQALQDALEQRDAVIDNLLMRVEQLERKLALSSGELDTVVAGGAAGAGALGAPSLPRPGVQGTEVAQVPSTEPVPQPSEPAKSAPNPPPANQNQGGGGANTTTQPGQFEVVEEEIDRALERTLVQTGVLLLPFGQAEVEPFFSYTREEGDVPVLFAEDGRIGTGNQQIRRNEFVSGQALRVGLPFDSQIELDLPYRYVQQSVSTPVGFGQREDEDSSGHGLGDLRVGLAKTLVRENGGWWPDLVARVAWDADTGDTTDNDVALGGGFNELSGSLSAIKRQDPLAFVGAVSYEKSFENNNVEPGDELGFNLGTVLAASPTTSLRLALNQRFINNSKVDGEGLDGSDGVAGTATFGASVILGRGVLLDVAADIGLTDDAPDYAARASLPIRFNLPTY